MTLVRFVFGDLEKQVRSCIEAAHEAGNTFERDIATQAMYMIENTQMAFSKDLDLTIDKVDATIKARIEELKGIVQEALKKHDKTASKLAERMQVFVNSLPFANTFPQVTEILPRNIQPIGRKSPIRIVVKGSFPDAAAYGYAPTFSFGSNPQISHVENFICRIAFDVPVAMFPTPEKDHPCIYGQINFPQSRWNPLKLPYVFKTTFGVLPELPGRVTIVWDDFVTAQRQQAHTSQQWSQRSGKCVAPRDIRQTYTERPTNGWKVVKGSSRFTTIPGKRCNHTTPKGSWTQSLVSEDDHSVAYQVLTRFVGNRQSGDVTFCIKFQEHQEFREAKPQQESIECQWGQGIVRTLSVSSNPRITFTDFQNKSHPLPIPCLEHRFVEVRRNGDNILINVKNTEDVN